MKNVLFQPDFARVQDDKTLIRDTSNNAILAASIEEKRKYVEAQQKELNKRKVEKESAERMEKIEREVDTIKTLLTTLLNKLEVPQN